MTDIPSGVFPINIRGVTCQKYGLKTGEGIHDYVKYNYISKEEITKEIQLLGVMSDFEPGRKHIEAYVGEQILFVIDLEEKYGEMVFFCYTQESEESFKSQFMKEEEEALTKQQQDEQENAAPDLSHLVYEDKPMIPKVWVSTTENETNNEINDANYVPIKPVISIAITRPKSSLNLPVNFSNEVFSDSKHKMKSQRSMHANFIMKKEFDNSFQVAPMCQDTSMQTMKNKPIHKAIQYASQSLEQTTNTESELENSVANTNLTIKTKKNSSIGTSMNEDDNNEQTERTKKTLITFLSKSSHLMESFLKRNKAIEIFHDTFQIKNNTLDGDGSSSGNNQNVQVENELKEIKNFADPMYSKSKVIVAMDWLPKFSGYVAISVVKNIGFDQRLSTSGLSQTSHVLIWDFKQLVKPLLIMQAPSEIFTLKFNKINPSLLVGGSITGQVVLWDLSNSLHFIKNSAGRNNRSVAGSTVGGGPWPGSPSGVKGNRDSYEEDEEIASETLQASTRGLAPKYISTLDKSHRKCVSDIFWLPPTTQINHMGELVSDEHLDGNCYQFLTIAADGMMMVWDIRFEEIFNDELRHIARAKHIAQEKLSAKEGGLIRPLWSPIFCAHLKRLEGVGELGLCKLSFHPKIIKMSSSNANVPQDTHIDPRSQFMLGTEEGDILLADLCTSHSTVGRAATKSEKSGNKDEEDDDNMSSREYVKWSAEDHARPPVGLQQSPFFPEIVLTVSDWKFNIWKVGDSRPLFSSPLSPVYYTTGSWSPTRPSVLYAGCANGNIEVWDLSDSSTKASMHLKATQPQRLTSMEFMSASSAGRASTQPQLLACGDDAGTLHVFEVPRSLSRALPKEESVMEAFLKKQSERQSQDVASDAAAQSSQKGAAAGGDDSGPGADTAGADKGASKFIASSGRTAKLLEEIIGGGETDDYDLSMTKKEEEEFDMLESKFIADLNVVLNNTNSDQ